jgi:peptidoglycan/xylan/chitin deacetylase (PgdA/CDA1 family)
MATITIHHIHGGKYPAVKGSISLAELEKAVQSEHSLTFDDGLACQELAFPILKKYGKTAIFFINNDNIMESHKQVMDALGGMFYQTFWKYVANTAFIVPNWFLAEYSFYTAEDRKYRYYRDYVDTKRHDEIMHGLAGNFNIDPKLLFIDLQKIVDNGFTIGMHSGSHIRRMDLLKPHEQYSEWMTNLGMIRKYQREVVYASYPMGRYNEVTKEVLRQLGVTEAFTSSEFTSGYLETPRIDIKIFLAKV